MELVAERYGVTARGNFEGSTVLSVVNPEVDVPEDTRRRLLEARAHRPQPARDDKALAAWNGLALSAFAEAGLRLERADYVETARVLAEFLLTTMANDRGGLYRTYRAGEAKIDGYLEDYANVANGLLDLYTATGELRYLEEARRIAELARELFEDSDRGGYFFTPAGGERLVARKKELVDQPVPSGNSMLATVLLRIARMYGDDELERRAVAVFRLGYRLLERAPGAVGQLLCALDLHFSTPREVAIVGRAGEPETESLRRAAFERFEPSTVYAFADGPDDPALDRVPLLTGKGLVDGGPAAYVCESFACMAPVTDASALRAALAG